MNGLDKVKAEISETMSEIGVAVEQQKSEIAKNGETAAKTAKTLETLNAKFDSHLEEFAKLKKEADEAITKANRVGNGGGRQAVKSFGELFVESEAFKAARKADERNVRAVKFDRSFLQKTVSGLSNPDVLNVLGRERLAQIISLPERMPRVRDLFRVVRTNRSAIEFVEETNFYHLAALVSSAISPADTVLAVDNANGFFDGQTITLSPGLAQEETATIAASGVDIAAGTLTVTSGVANAHPAGRDIVADRFVYTPETTLKPNAKFESALRTIPVKTLAHGIPASRQILDDTDSLRDHIDMRLLEGLMLVEEESILRGDGSDQQLDGIMVNARTQTYDWSSGAVTPVPDTKLDALRRAATLASKANMPADGCIISEDDWEDIELTKGTDGHYLWQSVGQGPAQRVWRMTIVPTTAMLPGEALVGAFSMGAAIYDRMESTIRISESHNDQFMRNMIQILAESRQALVNYRPEAFVNVSFDSAPT